jgi:hypothetical protein
MGEVWQRLQTSTPENCKPTHKLRLITPPWFSGVTSQGFFTESETALMAGIPTDHFLNFDDNVYKNNRKSKLRSNA